MKNNQEQDRERVNAAVKIKIQLDREKVRGNAKPTRTLRLNDDLKRLMWSMTNEEYTEYLKRIEGGGR